MKKELFAAHPDAEIRTSRIMKYSQEKVFEAWANPTHLKNWWGPNGFSNTFNEHDFQVGGRWSFVMHGPEQGNYANECEFTHIEQPALIAWKRHSKPLFRVVATFEKEGENKTLLTFRMVFDTPEECAKVKKFVVDKNEENIDRLEIELARMS